MKRKKKLIGIIFAFSLSLITPVWAQNTGLVPVPAFSRAEVGADISYHSGTGLYTYNYTITNPTTNTGKIWTFNVDISLPKYGLTLSSDGLILSYSTKKIPFKNALSKMEDCEPIVPVGTNVPSGWSGDIICSGSVGFFGGNEGPNILPGETIGEFQIISRGLPAIRIAEVEPWWIFEADREPTHDDTITSREVEASLKYTTKTIGPTAPPLNLVPATFLDLIKSYIDESVTLGWFLDTTLARTLKTKLDSISALIKAEDPSSAKIVLGEMMDIINSSMASQLTAEAKGLLYYNIQYLKSQIKGH
jgi:hypothetical protein